MYRNLLSLWKLPVTAVILATHVSVAAAEDQPGFLTAEELVNIYSPVEQTEGNKPLTRGMKPGSDRGLAGVRKSKTAGTNQRASTDNVQQSRRHSFVNILFGVNSVNLKPESYRQLDEIGKALGVVMNNHSEAVFVVEGHTDSTGTEARNEILSINRAEAIRKYLLGRFGFDEDRIRSVGFGERAPVVSNDTEAGRMLNRRVEIIGK